jgi:hypothetical protein
MEKIKKRTGAIVFLVIGILAVGLGTYRLLKWQWPLETQVVNDTVLQPKILIAAQSTKFKDSVLEKVVQKYEGKNVYLEILDITQSPLPELEAWDRIILFSTIESGDLYPEASAWIVKFKNEINRKVYVFNTADSGRWAHNEMQIDAVTAPSKKVNADLFADTIIKIIDSAF